MAKIIDLHENHKNICVTKNGNYFMGDEQIKATNVNWFHLKRITRNISRIDGRPEHKKYN